MDRGIETPLQVSENSNFDVPQGSVLRPILFTLCTAPLSHVIVEPDVEHRLYADDTQIYISLSGSETLESLTDL